MGRKPSGRPAGRPEKPIDWNQFEQLCSLQCTQSEIASMFKTNIETIRTRVRKQYSIDYLDAYKRFAEAGKCSLRRNQFVISKKNASMAIWLGKIWLGQKDPCQEEAKEDILHVLKAAIREIQYEPRIDAPKRSSMEAKQSVLDQKYGGKTTKIFSELGSEDTVGGDACV